MSRNLYLLSAVIVGLAVLSGCGPAFGPKASHGITFYAPGAGNFDFGDVGLREGLRQAGYPGQVAGIVWTVSFNAAIDQRLGNARIGGTSLARHIEKYADEFPGQPINLVGLSAGTGVVVWALEDLKPGYEVDTVVLLSSSLWYRYDVSKALTRLKGKLYNYYSTQDPVLAGPMKIFGTIDGVFGQDGAGAVGLKPPGGSDKIVNIRWKPEYRQYGYHGGHTDSTSAAFIRHEISKHITFGDSAAAPPQPGEMLASAGETTPPAARRN